MQIYSCKRVRGPQCNDPVNWTEYGSFHCDECALSRFYKRTHGRLYNGAWEE